MPFPFLNPGWLAGTAGAAAPIIIHLLNKQRYKRMLWAAMEFLRQAIEKRRRRLRIEQLILLAVRTLVLLLLAFILARPFIGAGPLDLLTQSSTLRVFVVDNSFSMGYDVGGESALERAKKAAVGVAERMRGQDASSILLANEAPVALYEQPMSDRDRVKETLTQIRRSDRATDIPKAIEAAAKIVAQNQLPANVIYVFTDLQQEGWRLTEPDRAAALKRALDALVRKTRIVFIDVGAPDPSNVAVVAVDVADPIVATLIPTRIEADVTNFSDGVVRDVPVELLVDDRSAASDVLPELKPGATVRKSFNYTFQRPGYHAVRLQTRADSLTVDDQRFLGVNVRDAVKVLIVDGQPASGGVDAESFLLRLAMRPEAQSYLERRFVLDPVVVNEIAFEQEALSAYDLVVLANLSRMSEERLRAVEGFVRRGGALMVFVGDLTAPDDYNALFHRKNQVLLPVKLQTPVGNPADESTFVRLKITDPLHPVMRNLLDFASASLANVRVYRYMTAAAVENDPRVQVLARFDDPAGTPAIVDYGYGKGRVCYFGTTADGAWHNLALRIPLYAILVHEMSLSVVQPSTAGKNLSVGEEFVRGVTPEDLQGRLLLTTPDGETEELPVEGDPGAQVVRYGATERAGSYALEVRAAKTTEGFAVNVPPRESNLARIDEAQLREALPQTENVTYEFRRADESALTGGRPPESELWKTLAYVLIALVCIESFLAWKFGRYK